jgi:hypothetical protein
LDQIKLADDVLAYKNLSSIRLAPGDSASFVVSGRINSTITNWATATGTPSLGDGTTIPNTSDVTASDPSSVTLVTRSAGINIENTVYLSEKNGGTGHKCATSNLEVVQGYSKTTVMYCFAVSNVGEAVLTNVVVTNAELNSFKDTIAQLSPGETKYIAVYSSIAKNLTNFANVIASPSAVDGTPIPNAEPVRDTDPSRVDQIEYAPRIVIENSVYVGRDGGKQCGTSAARDVVDGLYGTEVTFCFNVTNRGDTPLSSIIIANEALSYQNGVSQVLKPREWVMISLDRTILSDMTNNAIVAAMPTIPDLAAVSSQDTSAVNKFDFVPGIKVENKVYLGSNDNGARCGTDAARESVSGAYATPVTYCFKITNTGDTSLDSIVLVNEKLAYKKDDLVGQLAPGKSIAVFIPGYITEDVVNVAVVTANPVTDEGKDIGDLSNVSSEDSSEVKKISPVAAVKISNTVYVGKDGGKKCGTLDALETVSARYGTNVTYCFLVTNSGKSHLKSVVVEDPALGYSDATIDSLAPNATKLLVFESRITSTLANMANVIGSPALENGIVLMGMDPVMASDPSSVIHLPQSPRIEIDNLAVLGSNADKCDSPAAVDYVEHYPEATVTYCFAVTNKGDTYLSDVTIANAELKFKDSSIQKLAPGESAIVAFTSKIRSSLKNVACVTGKCTRFLPIPMWMRFRELSLNRFCL